MNIYAPVASVEVDVINTLLSSNKLTVTPSIPGSPASWIPSPFKSSNTKSPIEFVGTIGWKNPASMSSFGANASKVKIAVLPVAGSKSLSKLSVVASCGEPLNVLPPTFVVASKFT